LCKGAVRPKSWNYERGLGVATLGLRGVPAEPPELRD
jgi:hypothetical protein